MFRCGVESRVLFGGTDPRPDVNIPAWLCGSPNFRILALNPGDVEFLEGVVLVENEPIPGNIYTCDSPNIPVGSDLRHQDVATWQSTDYEEMVEHRYHASPGADPEFADLAAPVDLSLPPVSGVKLGHMGEYADSCGSTRARVRGGSYFGNGFHIHPNGTAAEGLVDPTPDNTLLEFHRITRYKLALLEYSIVIESQSVLGRNDFKYMKKQVEQAIKQMNKGNFNAAYAHVCILPAIQDIY